MNQVFWPCRVVSTQPCGTVPLWHCYSTLSEATSSLYFVASTRLVNYMRFTKPKMHTVVLWLQQGRHPKYISFDFIWKSAIYFPLLKCKQFREKQHYQKVNLTKHPAIWSIKSLAFPWKTDLFSQGFPYAHQQSSSFPFLFLY